MTATPQQMLYDVAAEVNCPLDPYREMKLIALKLAERVIALESPQRERSEPGCRMTAREMVKALLDEHQRVHSHHTRLCALCAVSREFLGLPCEVELCSECEKSGPVRLGEIATHRDGCFRCGSPLPGEPQ